MKIEDLKQISKKLYDRALECQALEGHYKGDETVITDAFFWSVTTEGYVFWGYINEGEIEQAKKLQPHLFEQTIKPMELKHAKELYKYEATKEMALYYFNEEELKEKKSIEEAWSELIGVNGCYVTTNSSVPSPKKMGCSNENKNIYPSKKEAEFFGITVPMLAQLRDSYNSCSLEEVFSDCNRKHYIISNSLPANFLVFKTEETRDKFEKDFGEEIDNLKFY